MKHNKWTLALAAAGVVSLGSVARAEEAVQHQVLTALSSTTLSGYVDTSAIWKLGTDRGGGRLPGHTFDGPDKMDGFNLEAVALTLEKPLDEGKWSAGYRAQMIFGPDANYYQTTLNGGGFNAGDFALKNAYVSLRAPVGNGLDFKVGVFDTIIGYEVFETLNNPNYSRSYGYALEPTHHTGILASYKFNDWLSAQVGVADTAFGPINSRGTRAGLPAAESIKAYMGALTLTVPDKAGPIGGSVVYLGIVNGLNGGTVFGAGSTEKEKTSNYYAGATFKTPMEGLGVGLAYDYRSDGQPAFGTRQENKAYSIAGYLSYTPKDSKFKINDRVDYFSGDAGTFYGTGTAVGSTFEGFGYAGVKDHNREHLISNTLTLDYSLWANVVTRGEFRWDHSLSGDKPFGGELNPMKNALILAANIIYKF